MLKLKAPQNGFKVYDDPLIQVIDNLLSTEDCQHIIELAKPHMKEAVVSGVDVISKIVDRISDTVGVPRSHAESLQVIYYGVTQQYKPHFDAYDLTTEVGKRCTAKGGQRLVTALLYLNDVEGGGGTTFPKAGCNVAARPGRAVIFHNCYDGTNVRHPSSLHGGMPVEKGEKWACNLWYRENSSA